MDNNSNDLQNEEAEASEESMDLLQEAFNKKETECKELNDKYLRVLAEMDNYRKRVTREQSESVKYANEKILSDLLAVVDNLDRAISHSKDKKEFDALIDGLDITLKEFRSVMDKYGVKDIVSVGEIFDPVKHHAVSIVESVTHDDNSIVEEFRKGYVLNDRVLRHSLVSVAKKKEKTETVE